MSESTLDLLEVVAVLRKHHGSPPPLPTTDPFELILFENVAYLASPARRRQAFEELKSTIGTAPAAVLAARSKALERVASRGILKATFAAKLRECARIAVDECGGDLGGALRRAPSRANATLRRFPGIGEPGADKVLLFAGLRSQLAPESNGLRVLVRLGMVREESSYSRTYAASRRATEDAPLAPAAMQEAHLLLQLHGQTVCKRRLPVCATCPLEGRCAYARGASPRS